MMNRLILTICLLVLPASSAFATFSIVAIDPNTGEMGIAVASRYFSVGAVVPWAEAEVGAVATQASVNVGYGPRALELLKEGLTAQQVLDRLFEEDTFPGKGGRQIAIVDRRGNVAVFTGPDASDWRGHRKGATYSAQGNILAGPEVVEAMGEAFENTDGELTERLYAALKAGDAAGGDRRGRQSASILVVGTGIGRNTNNDRYAYLNVDDHTDPIGELRRLLDIQLGINNSGLRSRALREGEIGQARQFAERAARYRPDNANGFMHLGFLSYLTGAPGPALDAFSQARALSDDFVELWNRMVETTVYETIAEDTAFVARVMDQN